MPIKKEDFNSGGLGAVFAKAALGALTGGLSGAGVAAGAAAGAKDALVSKALGNTAIGRAYSLYNTGSDIAKHLGGDEVTGMRADNGAANLGVDTDLGYQQPPSFSYDPSAMGRRLKSLGGGYKL